MKVAASGESYESVFVPPPAVLSGYEVTIFVLRNPYESRVPFDSEPCRGGFVHSTIEVGNVDFALQFCGYFFPNGSKGFAVATPLCLLFEGLKFAAFALLGVLFAPAVVVGGFVLLVAVFCCFGGFVLLVAVFCCFVVAISLLLLQ